MKFVIVCSLTVFSLAVRATAQTQIRTDAVTGAPYSAEQITERVQTLADGTHITHPSEKTMLYRDSQGRTRIEQTFPRPPGTPEGAAARPSHIEVNDPLSGVHYTLDERRHTATRFSFPTALPAHMSDSAAIRPTKLLALSPGQAIAQVQSAPSHAAQSQKPQISRESLGTQTIEGILVEGTRTTVVHPVGSVDNDRPITAIQETWTSPELKVTVLEKDSDPRYGESTIRLANISRAEPDAALFQVPPDYQIIDPQAASPNQ